MEKDITKARRDESHEKILFSFRAFIFSCFRQELLVDTNSDCLVNYTNIRRGIESLYWQTGAGNIDADPDFRRQEPGFYHFSLSSPCLDAGDPNITDPDGSPPDMGAYGGYGADWSILIMAVGNRIIRADKLFSLDIKASAPDPARSLYYNDDTDLFDINPISGKIEFTPNSSHIGKYEIVISVTTGVGMTGIYPFHLTITPGEKSYQFFSPLNVLVFPIFYPLLFDGLAPYLISPLSPSTRPIVREAHTTDFWPGSWLVCLWISSIAPYSGYLSPYPFNFSEQL